MNLNHLILTAKRKLLSSGKIVKSEKWQATDLKNPMFEAIKVYLGPAQMPPSRDELQALLKPLGLSIPWAEDHLAERLSGIPSNPGEQYKNWPYWNGQKEMMAGDKFSHTYQERFWPKVIEGVKQKGVRYNLGDFGDVVNLIVKDPYTRQAFLPIWFPEDTGAVHKQRVPCTIGYLFQFRDGYLHITYYIRSCDLIRHFVDDIYLAVRLAQEVCLGLKLIGITQGKFDFSKVKPGLFDMHIGSLHIFSHEVKSLEKNLS